MLRRNNLKSVLIDLSGTLHIENDITPQAVDALRRLRETKVHVRFVTNTTKESRRILHERLVKLGFDIQPDEIFSSLWAASDLIKKHNLKPMYFLEEAAMEDFRGLEATDKLDSVIIGLAPEKFNWVELTKAFRLLIDGAKLIAIHAGRYYKRKDGLALGPGPFVKALEYGAGVQAAVVGKPSADFFLAALGDCDPSQAVMIGDDVIDDIDGSQKVGIKGYLVKTGKYRLGDEKKIDPQPYQTVENFSEAVNHILQSYFQ